MDRHAPIHQHKVEITMISIVIQSASQGLLQDETQLYGSESNWQQYKKLRKAVNTEMPGRKMISSLKQKQKFDNDTNETLKKLKKSKNHYNSKVKGRQERCFRT